MGNVNLFFRDVPDELLFRLQRGFGIGGEPDSGSYPENMGIHRHIRLLMYHGSDYIGGFTPYTRELHQFLDRVGNFTLECLRYLLRHAYQVTGFIIGIADALDQGE